MLAMKIIDNNGRNIKDIIKALPEDRKAKVLARAAELMKEMERK